MARKRISEEDLLNFRKQAGELAKVVEEKYNRMDDEKKAEIEPKPTGDRGILLIHDAAENTAQLDMFAEKLKARGMVADIVDLRACENRGMFDRTPLWQRWLEAAQSAYQSITERCEKVIVLGTGLSCPLACVIAEQYSVDALVIVGGGLKREGFALSNGVKGTSFQLARLAKNNLFSVVCPIMCLVPENCAPYSANSANMYQIASRSEDVCMEKFPGVSTSDIWTKCEDRVLEAVLGFFDGV